MKNKVHPKLPSNKNFGIVFSIFFFLIFIYYFLQYEIFNFFILILSLIFFSLGIVNSKILSPLNYIWFRIGLILGKIISPIILAIIFFIVVTPVGLIMRLFGKDLLNLKYNKKETYWIKNTDPKSKMKNQF